MMNKGIDLNAGKGHPKTLRKTSIPPSGPKSRIPTTNVSHSARTSSQNANTEKDHARRSVSRSQAAISSSGRAKLPPAPGGVTPAAKVIAENHYTTKRSRYMVLKKELEEKQRLAHGLRQELTQLRGKLISNGSKDPGDVEDILLLSALRSKDEHGDKHMTGNFVNIVPNEFVSTLEPTLRTIPAAFFEVCQQVIDKRSEVVKYLTEVATDDLDNPNFEEIKAQITVFKNEEERLMDSCEELKMSQYKVISDTVKKVDDLWRECETLRESYKILKAEGHGQTKQLHEKMESLIKELGEEQAKNIACVDSKRATETLLQKSKMKSRDLESQVAVGDAKVEQINNCVKQMEAHAKEMEIALKLKETALEHKNEELQTFINNYETVSEKLERAHAEITELQKENDNLLCTTKELKILVDERSNEGNARNDNIAELQQQLAEIQKTATNLQKGNEELTKELHQKQLEIDNLLASNQLKIDDKLETMQNEDCKSSEHKNPEDLNKELEQVQKQMIEKDEELRQLYSTLESKANQISHLEKLLRRLEDQHDHSQAHRIRLEKMIAKLQTILDERHHNQRSSFGIL